MSNLSNTKPLKRKAPDDIAELFHWQTNRRQVLRAAIIAGSVSQLGFLSSCLPAENSISALLDKNQELILKSILSILFPDDGNGPSVEDLNTYDFILWVLTDPGANQRHVRYVTDGISWADENALEKTGYPYAELNEAERERAVSYFVQDEYGKEWCSILMTLIIESLLIDPIYGVNTDQAGWNWLNHTPGQPRATEELRYEKILETVRNAYPPFNHEV